MFDKGKTFIAYMIDVMTAIGMVILLVALIGSFILLVQYVSEKARLKFVTKSGASSELETVPSVSAEVRPAEQPSDPGDYRGRRGDLYSHLDREIDLEGGVSYHRSEDPSGADGPRSADEEGRVPAGVEGVHPAGSYWCDNSRCDRWGKPHWHQAGDSAGGGIRYIRTDG